MDNLLSRGVVNIIPGKKELEDKLAKGQKLHIYLGIDPTATKIHLGHAVPLRKLQAFADLGHHVTFLIGDFTALIGDTSDKDTERPVLTSEQIEENFKTYKLQAEKIVDFSKVEVRHNSEWLSKLTFPEIVKLCQHFSFGDFASRELIKKRLQEGKHVGLHEALYPVMQGYDSFVLKTDVQIGGADQTFNMQAGRTLIQALEERDSFVLATPYLTGTDGRKMSKSWGNAIWLDDSPDEMFRKVMSVEDSLIIEYFTLATTIPEEEISKIEKRLKDGENPRDIKKELGVIIVSELYSENDAKKAQEEFEKTVQNHELPTNLGQVTYASGVSLSTVAMEHLGTQSLSEWKRVVEQGGVYWNDNKITNPSPSEEVPDKEGILKIGSHKMVRVKIK